MRRRLLFGIAVAVVFVRFHGVASSTEVLFQSATMGPTVSNPNLNPGLHNQHLGVRFTLVQAARIESIGGHVMGNDPQSTARVAIVPLEDDGFPVDSIGDAYPDLMSTALANSLLQLPSDQSAEVLGAVDVVLAAGTYGLVLGTHLFGGTGGEPSGTMIRNGTDIGNPEYFFWESGDKIWRDVDDTSGTRFVVVGQYIPEPAASTLAFISIGMYLVRRRRLRSNR